MWFLCLNCCGLPNPFSFLSLPSPHSSPSAAPLHTLAVQQDAGTLLGRGTPKEPRCVQEGAGWPSQIPGGTGKGVSFAWFWGISGRLQESVREREWSCSVMSNSLRRHGLQPTRVFLPWDSPGKDTGVGCHFLLQGIFPTQGSNPGLLHCRQTLYHLSHQGSPKSLYCLIIRINISPVGGGRESQKHEWEVQRKTLKNRCFLVWPVHEMAGVEVIFSSELEVRFWRTLRVMHSICNQLKFILKRIGTFHIFNERNYMNCSMFSRGNSNSKVGDRSGGTCLEASLFSFAYFVLSS